MILAFDPASEADLEICESVHRLRVEGAEELSAGGAEEALDLALKMESFPFPRK